MLWHAYFSRQTLLQLSIEPSTKTSVKVGPLNCRLAVNLSYDMCSVSYNKYAVIIQFNLYDVS